MENLIPQHFDDTIDLWLKEDVPSINYHAFIAGSQPEKATLFLKQTGMISGLPFLTRIFNRLNCKTEILIPEGVRYNRQSCRGAPGVSW